MPFLLLMPSFNQAHYIAEAVESCLAQDDLDWELWILDNSTDGTPDVMKAFRDERIHFLHEPRRMDPGSCLNQLLGIARGEHFSYVHADNRLLPGYVGAFRAALSQHPLALAHCDYLEIDADGRNPRRRRRPQVFPPERLFSCDSLGVPFAATTALAARVGGFSVDDLADDVFFVMRADGLGPRIHVGKALLEYRVHESQRGRVSRVDDVIRSMYRSALKAYRMRGVELADPFLGMQPEILAHVDRAAKTATVLARALLARVPASVPIWIEGSGPASFWLAWACAQESRTPAGFRVRTKADTDETMLGLPLVGIDYPLPEGHVSLSPRSRSLEPASVRKDWLQALRWMMHGLPPLSQALRRYPPAVMSSLLIPLHHRSPGEEPVWVRGRGAEAAYLAFGAESIAGLPLAGWISDVPILPGGRPTLAVAPEGARVWNVPGEPGPGVIWSVPRG